MCVCVCVCVMRKTLNEVLYCISLFQSVGSHCALGSAYILVDPTASILCASGSH